MKKKSKHIFMIFVVGSIEKSEIFHHHNIIRSIFRSSLKIWIHFILRATKKSYQGFKVADFRSNDSFTDLFMHLNQLFLFSNLKKYIFLNHINIEKRSQSSQHCQVHCSRVRRATQLEEQRVPHTHRAVQGRSDRSSESWPRFARRTRVQL